ncbi:MAG: hypothetical protein RL268_2766, partial [Pseudomonadota bacterium]
FVEVAQKVTDGPGIFEFCVDCAHGRAGWRHQNIGLGPDNQDCRRSGKTGHFLADCLVDRRAKGTPLAG